MYEGNKDYEKFLRDRFRFEQVHMIMQYEEGVRKKSIESEWENIICYMAHKYPLMKPLLLLKSQIEVTENQINVYMKIQGADFLKARKLDRELESVIENIFGKKYIVNIEERINAEEVLKQKEKAKQVQQKAIENVMREAMEAQRMAAEKQAQNSGENMQNNHQQHPLKEGARSNLLLEAALRPLEEQRRGEQGRILHRQGGDGAVQPLARRGVRRAAVPPDPPREERALRPFPESGVRPRDGGQKVAPIPVRGK